MMEEHEYGYGYGDEAPLGSACGDSEADRLCDAAEREMDVIRAGAERKTAALRQECDALKAELAGERAYNSQLRALWAALEPHLQNCTRTDDILVIDAPNDEPTVSAGYADSDTWGTSDIILCDAGLLAQLIDALEKLALGVVPGGEGER